RVEADVGGEALGRHALRQPGVGDLVDQAPELEVGEQRGRGHQGSRLGSCGVYPGAIAQQTPDKAAYIMGATGEAVTYAQLDARSNQVAHLLRARGLRRGDSV